MANTERLRQVLTYIEQHPDEWEQGDWRCDSGMCFAGHAVDISKVGRWAAPANHPLNNLVRMPDDVYTGQVVGLKPDGETFQYGHSNHADMAESKTVRNFKHEGYTEVFPVEAAQKVANDWLELDDGQSTALFGPDNTLVDLQHMVANLEAGRGIWYGHDDESGEWSDEAADDAS